MLVRSLYAAVRRAGVVDVMRLLHLPASALQPIAAPPCYEIGQLSAAELEDLLARQQAPVEIGDPDVLRQERHRLVVARQDQRVVAYVWLTRQYVEASENFSRASHLGTPLSLAPDAALVHTAKTLPEHRGQRLLPALLTWAVQSRLGGSERWLATVDWTNAASHAAFARVGFKQLGLLWRLGRGPLQATRWPSTAPAAGAELGDGLPGLRL